jgi:nucleoside-diphosphate-sugar epimerase
MKGCAARRSIFFGIGFEVAEGESPFGYFAMHPAASGKIHLVRGWLSEDFRKITTSFRVSSAKFEKDLHFTPPFTLEEGIERTVEWYKRSAR